MIYQAIGIGIVVSFAFYEIVGLSPGGIVVPGYIALFLDQPIRILVTLLAALLTYFIVRKLSNYIILYGRRRFLAMILIGFLLKWLIDRRDYNYNPYFRYRTPEYRLYNSRFNSQRNEKTGYHAHNLFSGNSLYNS